MTRCLPQEQFCVVLSRLNSIHACCGAHAQNAIHKVLEALHSLLTRDEERESKHLQHVGGGLHCTLCTHHACRCIGLNCISHIQRHPTGRHPWGMLSIVVQPAAWRLGLTCQRAAYRFEMKATTKDTTSAATKCKVLR